MLRISLLLSIGMALGGCKAVAPWERGNLAKPQMATEPHPAQQPVLDHIYRSREAAGGAAATQGGGCGCY